MDLVLSSSAESQIMTRQKSDASLHTSTTVNEQTQCPRHQPVKIKRNSNLTLNLEADKENHDLSPKHDFLGPITFSDELSIKHGFLHVSDQTSGRGNLRKFTSAPDMLQAAMQLTQIFADGNNATIREAEALAVAAKEVTLAFESVTEDPILQASHYKTVLHDHDGKHQRLKDRRTENNQGRKKISKGRDSARAEVAVDFSGAQNAAEADLDCGWEKANVSWMEKNNRPWDRERPMGNKFLCTFLIGIQEDPEFGVSRRIIGRGGENMRFISDLCRQICERDVTADEEIPNVKIRLRGRGSGFKERDTRQEANVPLQVNVSTSSKDAYDTAKREISYLLSSIYRDYIRLYGIEFHVKLFEHPQNPPHK